MAGRTLPNVGLTGFWGLGYDGFSDENDNNLLKLSVLCQGVALATVEEAPTGGANGDVYMVQTGFVYVKDADVWTAIPAQTGWRLFDFTGGDFKTFIGGVWQTISEAGGIDDAPSDGSAYVRKDAAWVATVNHVFISQVDYDALSPPDANTIYYIPEV